jgi:DNA-binding NarL/FixJ family response regulator
MSITFFFKEYLLTENTIKLYMANSIKKLNLIRTFEAAN